MLAEACAHWIAFVMRDVYSDVLVRLQSANFSINVHHWEVMALVRGMSARLSTCRRRAVGSSGKYKRSAGLVIAGCAFGFPAPAARCPFLLTTYLDDTWSA